MYGGMRARISGWLSSSGNHLNEHDACYDEINIRLKTMNTWAYTSHWLARASIAISVTLTYHDRDGQLTGRIVNNKPN